MTKSIVVVSGKVDIKWLCGHLTTLWFGGEHSIYFNPRTLDIYPVRYRANGELWVAVG